MGAKYSHDIQESFPHQANIILEKKKNLIIIYFFPEYTPLGVYISGVFGKVDLGEFQP